MDKQKVLVTGGAGYIGSHACKVLQRLGFIPVTFDNLVTGWRDAVKFGPLEKGDLLKKSDIDQVFERHSPVAVMHFAALSQVCLLYTSPSPRDRQKTRMPSSA